MIMRLLWSTTYSSHPCQRFMILLNRYPWEFIHRWRSPAAAHADKIVHAGGFLKLLLSHHKINPLQWNVLSSLDPLPVAD